MFVGDEFMMLMTRIDQRALAWAESRKCGSRTTMSSRSVSTKSAHGQYLPNHWLKLTHALTIPSTNKVQFEKEKEKAKI